MVRPSYGASSGSDLGGPAEPSELPSTEELLDLATEWVAAADELNMQFVAQAVIDGEARLALDHRARFSHARRHSRPWSTSTTPARSACSGIATASGPATPKLTVSRFGRHPIRRCWGFAGQTVDDLLANPDRLYLEPFISLLDFAWLTRTIEGGGPAVYELVIETGYLTPEDPWFNEIVMILKGETAELLAESVYIESIDHYSTTLTMVGENGQVTSQITTAEFQTDAGRVELVSSLNIVSNGPIEFSTPTK